MAPFVVSAHTLPPVNAREFGMTVHPRAPAFVFPSLGAYVGGDSIVAGMRSRSRTPTAAATARSTRRWPAPGSRGCAASTATTCSRSEVVAEALAEEPGTYFLTDFLARTFERTVVRELGLDRHPELRDEYFRNYTRVLWLAQRPTPPTRAAARRAADRIGLPLLRARGGADSGLECQLEG